MDRNIYTINGPRRGINVLIVGCVHGDEKIGRRVFESLKNIKLERGSVSVLLANKKALKKGKRFIHKDLNRSFPGKVSGPAVEDRLAHKLLPILRRSEIVLDIHATNSKIDELVIVTSLKQSTRFLLSLLSIQKVALIGERVFGGGELIRYCKMGASLEYGPNKSGRNYRKALKAIREVLANLRMLRGKRAFRKHNRKELYIVSGKYSIKNGFKPERNFKEFRLIREGETIGTVGKRFVRSRFDFYPLFLGKGRYKETFALVSKRKYLTLK